MVVRDQVAVNGNHDHACYYVCHPLSTLNKLILITTTNNTTYKNINLPSIPSPASPFIPLQPSTKAIMISESEDYYNHKSKTSRHNKKVKQVKQESSPLLANQFN